MPPLPPPKKNSRYLWLWLYTLEFLPAQRSLWTVSRFSFYDLWDETSALMEIYVCNERVRLQTKQLASCTIRYPHRDNAIYRIINKVSQPKQQVQRAVYSHKDDECCTSAEPLTQKCNNNTKYSRQTLTAEAEIPWDLKRGGKHQNTTQS